MTSRTILLIADNPDGEALALRALRKDNAPNSGTFVRGGAAALDHLFSGNPAGVPREQTAGSGRPVAAR